LQPLGLPQPDSKQPFTEAFIVTSLGHITHYALTLSGQSAFVRAAFGKGQWAIVTMKHRQANPNRRPMGSMGCEDWLPPGEGGA
jgi:hypothetical protein